MILALWACSNEIDFLGLDRLNKGEKSLQVITRVLTTKSMGFVQEFPSGATIGLHVTSGSVGDPYDETADYKNVKAVASFGDGKITWQRTPEIRLNYKKTTIYAYYPYQAGIDFNAREIPVRISSNASETNDFMYGTHAIGQKAVNNVSPIVLLSMNHALSLISFQLKQAPGEKRAFIVSSLQIRNKLGKTTLAEEGIMDIVTGKITVLANENTSASTLLALHRPITLVNTFSDVLRLKVIPTAKTIGTGEAQVLFTINGKSFTFEIPANTQWKKGEKYLYKLNFNGKSFHLENISVEDWLPGDGECDINKGI